MTSINPSVPSAIIILLLFGCAHAATFSYQDPGTSQNPQRNIIYDVEGEDINEIYNDDGLWVQGFGPLSPGSTAVLNSGSGFAGVLHRSELAPDYLCGTVHAWNVISSDDPVLRQDAESSITVPFSLNQMATVRIHFSGGSHFIDNRFGSQLFIPRDFSIREGLAGNGSTITQISGARIEYVELPAGEYRLSAGLNESLSCSPFPCDKLSVGDFKFNLDIVDGGAPGSLSDVPYVPDQVLLNSEPEQQFVETNGALIYRGGTESHLFNQKASGWFEVNARNLHLIQTADASIISSIGFPDQLTGNYDVQVNEVHLGRFGASETVVFADYSHLLGDALVTGVGGIMGVTSLWLSFRPTLSQQFIDNCGFQNQQAIELTFDQTAVDVNIESTLIQDPLFAQSFE